LFSDDGFEGERGGTMTAAGVEIDQVDCRQMRFLFWHGQSSFWSGNVTGMCILDRNYRSGPSP
jgi:hypothetical protein